MCRIHLYGVQAFQDRVSYLLNHARHAFVASLNLIPLLMHVAIRHAVWGQCFPRSRKARRDLTCGGQAPHHKYDHHEEGQEDHGNCPVSGSVANQYLVQDVSHGNQGRHGVKTQNPLRNLKLRFTRDCCTAGLLAQENDLIQRALQRLSCTNSKMFVRTVMHNWDKFDMERTKNYIEMTTSWGNLKQRKT